MPGKSGRDTGSEKQSLADLFRRFVAYIKEYCANCSLVGFAYIANHHLHFSERIFWLICVILSTIGVYYLIVEYQRDFPIRAASIVYESISPFASMKYPAISVCETSGKSEFGPILEAYVQSLGKGIGEDYNYDVNEHVGYILFPNRYAYNTIKSNCVSYEKCEECAKCPIKDYRHIATMFGLNCTDVFSECSLSGKAFNCCQYFMPMITPYGRCFLLNSLQNNKPDSKHWLPAILDRNDQPDMWLQVKRPVLVSILNEEDLPTSTLPAVDFHAFLGYNKSFKFYSEAMVNDQDMRDISPDARNCLFPDEVPDWSIFRAYSFSACITDCTRLYQMELCNCTVYNMDPFDDKRFPDCDYTGYLCLERKLMVTSNVLLLKKFKHPRANCDCVPSCTEGDLQSIYVFDQKSSIPGANITDINISMPMWPTNQFRRQALRTKLDVVVSIGGILGLFLGASILSAIEFFYYFTMRAVNILLEQRRNAERSTTK